MWNSTGNYLDENWIQTAGSFTDYSGEFCGGESISGSSAVCVLLTKFSFCVDVETCCVEQLCLPALVWRRRSTQFTVQLWLCHSLMNVVEKFISFTQLLYTSIWSRVRAYGDVWPEVTTRSGVGQGPFLSICFLNFVMEMIIEIALSSYENVGINICANRNLSDLEYADDFMLPSEYSSKLIV